MTGLDSVRLHRSGDNKRGLDVCGILGAYDIAAVDDRRLVAVSEAIVHREQDFADSWSSLDDGHRVRSGTGICPSSTCQLR